MQALPPEIKKSVVFLYYIDKEGTRLAGTAFFVAKEIKETLRVAIYLITAKHVIENIKKLSTDDYVYIRINTKDGKSKGVRSEISKWENHPTDPSIDVSILAWAPDAKEFDYLNLPISMAVTDKIIEEEEIGEGDEVFLTGLFSNHFGETKNIPIVRTGNIALMSDEKVKTSIGLIDAYLIEARSIGGLSGSPVFAYLGHMRSKKGQISLGGQRRQLFVWLGVMHGHWDVDENSADGSDSVGIGKKVNMGIAIVVPALKVLEIIDKNKKFKEQRKIAKDEYLKTILPTEDSKP